MTSTSQKEYTIHEDENGEEFIVMDDQDAERLQVPRDDNPRDDQTPSHQPQADHYDDESYERPQNETYSIPSQDPVADEYENPHRDQFPEDDRSRDLSPDDYRDRTPTNLNGTYDVQEPEYFRGREAETPSPIAEEYEPEPEIAQRVSPPPLQRKPVAHRAKDSRKRHPRNTYFEEEPQQDEVTSQSHTDDVSAPSRTEEEVGGGRKATKAVVRGGMLIVDGGQWEPQARIDHHNKYYQRGGGNVQIFSDKPKWNAQPRIDDKKKDYAPGGGKKQIFSEKPQWRASPRIDADNKKHTPGGGDVLILHERLKWHKRPAVDSRNDAYVPARGTVKIFEEKPQWNTKPRVEARNSNFQPSTGNAVIIDEKLKWNKNAKVDHVKPYHKPGGGNVRVVSHAVQWNASSKVEAHNEDYVGPPGGNVHIFSEKPYWNAEARVEAKNTHYSPSGGNVKVSGKTLDWSKNANARVETLEKYYEHEPKPENVEFDPKTKRWVARGRLMRRPGTGQSLDSQLAVIDHQDGANRPRNTVINRAPAGTTASELITMKRSDEGYGNRFTHKRLRGPPLKLPPLDPPTVKDSKVLFRSRDLVAPNDQDDDDVKPLPRKKGGKSNYSVTPPYNCGHTHVSNMGSTERSMESPCPGLVPGFGDGIA